MPLTETGVTLIPYHSIALSTSTLLKRFAGWGQKIGEQHIQRSVYDAVSGAHENIRDGDLIDLANTKVIGRTHSSGLSRFSQATMLGCRCGAKATIN